LVSSAVDTLNLCEELSAAATAGVGASAASALNLTEDPSAAAAAGAGDATGACVGAPGLNTCEPGEAAGPSSAAGA